MCGFLWITLFIKGKQTAVSKPLHRIFVPPSILYVCRYHIYEFCVAWGVGEHPARNLVQRVPVSMCSAGADQRAQGIFYRVRFYAEVLCRFWV